MTLNTESLDIATEKLFNQLQQRVRYRLKSANELDWLLKEESGPPFQPDYLTMTAAGKNRFEQTLNRFFARLLPDLWFKFFWPKIAKGLVSYSEDSYFKHKVIPRLEGVALLPEVQRYFVSAMKGILSRNWTNLMDCTFTEISNCLVALIHEPLKQLPIEQDIFLNDKRLQNKTCLELLRPIKQALQSSANRLETLVYISCQANWIDCLEDDYEHYLQVFVSLIKTNWQQSGTLKNLPENSTFYQLEKLKRIIEATSGPILLEADNCGEIVFDLCLIEEFIARGRDVYLCVKGCPMVNDAMEKDVREVLEDDLFSGLKTAWQEGRLKLISAGSFIGGGKLAHEVSTEYREAYLASDLVIIKGQGNFQSMPMGHSGFGRSTAYNYRNSLVFMTGIKADMIQMCLTAYFPKKQRPPKNSILLHVLESN